MRDIPTEQLPDIVQFLHDTIQTTDGAGTPTLNILRHQVGTRQSEHFDQPVGQPDEWEEIIREVCNTKEDASGTIKVTGIAKQYEQHLDSESDVDADSEDLQVLAEVTEGIEQELNENGYETIGDILDATVDELAEFSTISEGIAQRIQEDASQYLDPFEHMGELATQREQGEAIIYSDEEFSITAGEPSGETFRGIPILEDPEELDGPHPLVPDVDEDFYTEPVITALGSANDLMDFGDDSNSTIAGASTTVVPEDQGLLDVIGAIETWGKFNMALRGEAGTGKSLTFKFIASQLNQPFIKITMGPDTTWDDLIGHFELVSDDHGNQVFKFVPGPLYIAVTKGALAVLEEVNAAPPETLNRLNSLLESDGTLTVPKKEELIEPHPSFRLCATMNPPDNDKYRGLSQLNAAFRNRFFIADVDYLPPEDELDVLHSQINEEAGRVVVERDTIETMVSVANKIRGGGATGDIAAGGNTSWPIVTTRTLQKACMLSDIMEPMDAFKSALNSECGPHDSINVESINNWWA